MDGQEYLDWEKQYGIKTIYGDYTRAMMELNKISTWDKYLQFREKWKEEVYLPDTTRRAIVCYPKYFGEISSADMRLVSNNLSYKIENYFYFYRGDYSILVREDNRVTDDDLSQLIDNKESIKGAGYYIVKRKIDDLDLRSECRDFVDPGGYLCRERLMTASLSKWLSTYIGNGLKKFYIEGDSWEHSERNIDIGWIANVADLKFIGVLDGTYSVCYIVTYEDHVETGTLADGIEWNLPFNKQGSYWWMEQYASDHLLTTTYEEHESSYFFVCNVSSGDDSDHVDYYLQEDLALYCDDVYLHCVNYE